MIGVAQWVVLSSGWPRRLAALLAGAIGALAMAPADVVTAMLIPMTMAVWLIDGSARAERNRWLPWRSCLAAAGVGWWWGFGYFLAGFWWLGAAFLVEPDRYAWLLPMGVVAVPALLAFFPAFGFAVARLFWSATAARVFALAAGLGIAEWLRSWAFTGFPWNAYGMALGDHLMLNQAASVVGVEGLTLATIVIFAAPATLADPLPRGRLRRFAPTAFAAMAFALLAGFGALRLSHAQVSDVPNVRLRIMQPNIPQDANFAYANKDKILADYLALSDRATSPTISGLKDVTHLIWPESPFPFILARDPDALAAISAALGDHTILLTGAARMETDKASGDAARPSRSRYFNAVEAIGPGGTILDSYDKVHLVPFGEYLPFDGILRSLGLTNFVHVPGGFEPGSRRRPLDVPGLPPIAPVICYEAIFSGSILPEGSGGNRAGLILNVTNDGWFGETAGPYQHFAEARLRAVEEGLPLVRAANSGISAIIDPYGRVRSELPLGVANVLDGTLPQRIAPTLFSRHWSLIQPLLYLAVLAAAVVFGMARQRQ